MMRSLFAAISGLRNQQTMMDVVGNNIANVNTTGFKQSRVTFQDILSQTIRGASSPQGGRGGVNPAQVGLGMVLSGIDTLQTQGTLQSTGKLTDMAIQGDGYFILSDGTNQFYSRDGSFDLATDGTLVNPASGLKVMGWQADKNGSVDTATGVGAVTIQLGQGMEGQVSKTATVTGNLKENVDPSAWAASNPAGGKLTLSGTPTDPTAAVEITVTAVTAGAVTGLSYRVWNPTTASWSAATTVAANTFTANGQTFTIASTSATPGNTAGDLYYTNAQAVTSTLFDTLGQPYSVRTIFQKTPSATAPSTWAYASALYPAAGTRLAVATGTLAFDTAGKVSSGGTGTIAITASSTPPGITNGAADMSVTLDLSGVTQLAGNGDLTATTDGAAAGTLSTFSIGQGGEITGIYSNGLKRSLGQLAVASFANPSGLLKNGGNLFAASANSGVARIGPPDTNGRGQVATGFLEASNVDLAQQFTSLIMAQRGFQANSRVITASDQLLQDLVNLGR